MSKNKRWRRVSIFSSPANVLLKHTQTLCADIEEDLMLLPLFGFFEIFIFARLSQLIPPIGKSFEYPIDRLHHTIDHAAINPQDISNGQCDRYCGGNDVEKLLHEKLLSATYA